MLPPGTEVKAVKSSLAVHYTPVLAEAEANHGFPHTSVENELG